MKHLEYELEQLVLFGYKIVEEDFQKFLRPAHGQANDGGSPLGDGSSCQILNPDAKSRKSKGMGLDMSFSSIDGNTSDGKVTLADNNTGSVDSGSQQRKIKTSVLNNLKKYASENPPNKGNSTSAPTNIGVQDSPKKDFKGGSNGLHGVDKILDTSSRESFQTSSQEQRKSSEESWENLEGKSYFVTLDSQNH